MAVNNCVVIIVAVAVVVVDAGAAGVVDTASSNRIFCVRVCVTQGLAIFYCPQKFTSPGNTIIA